MSSVPASLKKALLAAFALTAAVMPALYGAKFPSPPNPDNYSAIAQCFAASGELCDAGRPTAEREPGYPVVLGLAYKLAGHSYPVELALNGLIAAAAVLCLFVFGARLFGDAVGLLAAAICSVYPPFIYYASQPQREILLVLLSVISVGTLIEAARRGGYKRHAAAGAGNALAALSNTTFLPFGLGTAPVILLWLGRKRPAQALKGLAVYAFVLLALYSAWPIRNYARFHKMIVGSTAAAGTVFYVNQLVPAEVGGLQGEVDILKADPTYHEGEKIKDPAEHEKFFAQAGMRRLTENPLRWARLVAWRFFWEAWRPVPRPRAYEHSYRVLWWVSALTDGWIIPLGLLGLLFWRYRPAEGLLVPAFIASFDLVYSLIFFILRYRVPMMPWLILLAALSIVRLGQFFVEKELGL